MAPKLADAGFKALESPLPPNRIRDYQALKRQGALPILMDEGIVSPVEAEEFIALEHVRRHRDEGRALRRPLARLAHRRHCLRDNDLLLFASGLTDPDLSLAASLPSVRCRRA